MQKIKINKSYFIIGLVLLLGILIFPITTLFQSTEPIYADESALTIEYDSWAGVYKVVSCDNSATSVTIPAVYNDGINGEHNVEIIEGYAFSGRSNLTSITIPDTVTSIGYGAFDGCTGLEEIIFGENSQLISIGNGAFTNTPWDNNLPDGLVYLGKILYKYKGIMPENTEITIKDGVKSIGERAFYDCTNLISITIPDGVTSVGERAFSGCTNLTSITIPDSVTSIGNDAFNYCSDLQEVIFGEESQLELEGIGSNIFMNTPWDYFYNGLMYLGRIAYTYRGEMPENTEITIKDGVHTINSDIFKNQTNLVSINIPSTVKSIGTAAFRECTNLQEVTFGKNIQLDEITWDVFYNCLNLTSITIPDSVTSIEGFAFYNCIKITSIAIPDGVTSVGERAFQNCAGLTSIPDSVTSIGISAFLGCTSLTSITIPDTVTSIGYGAFEGCTGLEEITLGGELTNFNGFSFSSYQSLNKLTIRMRVFPGNKFYENKSLKTVIIADTVEEIGENSFYFCTGLEEIAIGAKLKDLNYAFTGSNNLKTITISPENEYYTVKNNVLFSKDEKTIYMSAKKGIDTNFNVPNGVTSIADYAFSGAADLTSITIPDSVMNIGLGAFYDCTSLTSITFKSSIPPVLSFFSDSGMEFDSFTGSGIESNQNAKIYVPLEGFNAYRNADDAWNNYVSKIEVGFESLNWGETEFSYEIVEDRGSEVDIIITQVTSSKKSYTIKSFYVVEGITYYVKAIGDGNNPIDNDVENITIMEEININNNAFQNCTSLINVFLKSYTPPSLGSNVFSGSNIENIFVPSKSINTYKTSAGWSEFSEIIQSLTVTVTFQYADGTIMDEQEIYVGDDAIEPNTDREGYEFIAWDKEFENITEDTVVTAIYYFIVYDVKFYDSDGQLLKQEEVSYNSSATPPTVPLSIDGLNFVGWDVSYENVKSDLEIRALYGYFVKFKVDGIIIKEQGVEPGENATAPDAPTKEGYTFINWDKDFTNVTEDIVVTAIYNINVYTVKFYDFYKNLLDEQNIEHGSNANPPDVDDKINDGDNSFKFVGWNGSYENVTENLNISAQYNHFLTVTFFGNDEETLEIKEIIEGESTTAPEPPVIDGYIFIKWSGDYPLDELNHVYHNMNFYAEYAPAFTVTFVDYNGDILKTELVQEYYDATAPDVPTKEGYSFAGWDNDFRNITEDITITAIYNINSYKITFNTNGGSYIGTKQYAYNSVITKPSNPTRNGYTFDGWFTDNGTFENEYIFENMPANNFSLYAKWKPLVYTVEFSTNEGKGNMEKQEFVYGVKQNLIINTFSRDGYTFDGWNSKPDGKGISYEDGENISIHYSDNPTITLYAQWSVSESYNIDFELNHSEGTPPSSINIKNGEIIKELPTPEREGYEFLGWFTPDGTQLEVGDKLDIERDTVLTARWKVEEKQEGFNMIIIYIVGGTLIISGITVAVALLYRKKRIKKLSIGKNDNEIK